MRRADGLDRLDDADFFLAGGVTDGGVVDDGGGPSLGEPGVLAWRDEESAQDRLEDLAEGAEDVGVALAEWRKVNEQEN